MSNIVYLCYVAMTATILKWCASGLWGCDVLDDTSHVTLSDQPDPKFEAARRLTSGLLR